MAEPRCGLGDDRYRRQRGTGWSGKLGSIGLDRAADRQFGQDCGPSSAGPWKAESNRHQHLAAGLYPTGQIEIRLIATRSVQGLYAAPRFRARSVRPQRRARCFSPHSKPVAPARRTTGRRRSLARRRDRACRPPSRIAAGSAATGRAGDAASSTRTTTTSGPGGRAPRRRKRRSSDAVSMPRSKAGRGNSSRAARSRQRSERAPPRECRAARSRTVVSTVTSVRRITASNSAWLHTRGWYRVASSFETGAPAGRYLNRSPGREASHRDGAGQHADLHPPGAASTKRSVERTAAVPMAVTTSKVRRAPGRRYHRAHQP